MKNSLILFAFSFLSSLASPAQYLGVSNLQGLPPMVRYSSKDFNKASSSIWAAMQSDNGMIYAASNTGLIEFDGEQWRFVESIVFQDFRKNAEGRIYTGGYNEIGYLNRNEKGNTEFVSLTDQIPDSTFVTLIRDVQIIDHLVYFISHEYVFEYNEKTEEVRAFGMEARLYPSFVYQDELIINVSGVGLHVYQDDSLILMQHGAYWADKHIADFVVGDTGELITLSSKTGAHAYTPTGGFQIELFDHSYLRDNVLFDAERLTNGNYALSFLTGGFVIADSDMQPLIILDQKAGSNNQVHDVFEDNQGDLWISTNNGLVYLNLSSPISHIGKGQGLDGVVVYDTKKHKDEWYVTGYSGTFYRKDQGKGDLFNAEDRFFTKIDNSEIGGTRLLETGGALFSLHTRKKGEIVDHKFIPLLENPNTYHAMGTVDEKNQVILTSRVTGNELEVFSVKAGRWKHESSIVNESLPRVLSGAMVFEDKLRFYYDLSADFKLARFRLAESLQEVVEVEILNGELGLPDVIWQVFEMEGSLFIGGSDGLYRYDSDQDLFSKDSRFGEFFDDKGLFFLTKEDDTSYWYQTASLDLGHLTILPDGTMINDQEIFAALSPGSITDNLEMLAPNKLGIGSLDGLYVVDGTKKEDHTFHYQPIIREVNIALQDSIIASNIEHQIGREEILEIPYEFNSLNFKYAVPYFKGVSELLYMTKLEGFDDDWSQWEESDARRYTNIPEGTYEFSVRAKNVFGHESGVTSYRFKIGPPWYLTAGAFVLYVLLLILVIYLIVYWNSRRLRKENLKLEGIIDERTSEIRDQKETIEKALVERESLLKEIHHRVKNNLQIIASLLYLQSGKFEDEDFKKVLEEGQGRVRSMALIHQKLYENDDLKSIPFGEYLQELVGEIRASFGMKNVQLNIEADNVFFDVDTAVPLGLIVNEIATNAFKYAFDEKGTGSFSIFLSKENGTYILNIKDDGKGLPSEIDIRKTKSLGLRLVRMLSQQLEGEFNFETHNGTSFKLEFAA
ncbi:histidine kinase dimerization/phosphoacceptor domain -containing protein [Reichenbachiella agariperforans]|uniref:histidine kinase dimerization/phosphoacceptor domain -containing protein n=1 Tax=Reichenbachiella agariperforans TaxID=156994 RepID=UPI001C0872B3|nr:histidine kinase dimerization/phosphoacceptor domain -containing protein [Reichenbachiella agariperforans]MBU2913932.1 hypothetical protein [Reichenbachiella agariperforans]